MGTLKRLRKGESNKSDLGGVLQTSNIHIAVAAPGAVTNALAALKTSPATIKAKAKFILATDGDTFEAEDLTSGATVACAYKDFPDHFGFFLPLAGITTVEQVRESSFDIRATSRLNRLYVELLIPRNARFERSYVDPSRRFIGGTRVFAGRTAGQSISGIQPRVPSENSDSRVSMV